MLHLYDHGPLWTALAAAISFVVVCAASILVFKPVERPMIRALRRKFVPTERKQSK